QVAIHLARRCGRIRIGGLRYSGGYPLIMRSRIMPAVYGKQPLSLSSLPGQLNVVLRILLQLDVPHHRWLRSRGQVDVMPLACTGQLAANPASEAAGFIEGLNHKGPGISA